MSELFLRALLAHLAAHRQFPKYQYERRIDGLISFFLPDVMRKQFSFETAVFVPEFPVKVSESEEYRSQNIDYFFYGTAHGQPQGYIVELKTDARSVRLEQLAYYRKLIVTGWPILKQEIQEISKRSDSKDKYDHLLQNISKIPDNATFDAIYIAPASAESSFAKARDTVFDAALRSRWLFMSLESYAATRIQTQYPDAWTEVSEHITSILGNKQ